MVSIKLIKSDNFSIKLNVVDIYYNRVFLDSRLRVSDSQNAVWDSQIIILRVLQDSQKL